MPSQLIYLTLLFTLGTSFAFSASSTEKEGLSPRSQQRRANTIASLSFDLFDDSAPPPPPLFRQYATDCFTSGLAETLEALTEQFVEKRADARDALQKSLSVTNCAKRMVAIYQYKRRLKEATSILQQDHNIAIKTHNENTAQQEHDDAAAALPPVHDGVTTESPRSAPQCKKDSLDVVVDGGEGGGSHHDEKNTL